MLWIAKYRPASLDGLVEQPYAKSMLAKFMATGQFPHLLLYGPPGVGKRSAAYILGNQLGMENFLELDVFELSYLGKSYLFSHPQLSRLIRSELRYKSLLWLFKHALRSYAGSPPVTAGFKLICISNAQELSFEAQQALRRMMERYSRGSRFILISIKPSKLIPALRSRCLGIYFSRLSDDGLRRILEGICNSERIHFKQDILDAIVYLARGNAAKAITLLQLVSQLKKPSPEAVFQLERAAKPSQLESMLESALSGDLMAAHRMLLELLSSGALPAQILEWLYFEILEHPKLSDQLKSKLVIKIADLELELNQSLNKYISLQRLLSELGHG